jgi:uncharacterized protein GlcG (DUF336 family)
MALTIELALRMIKASHDKAGELGIHVSTAIVDAEGRLFAFGRMEDAPWSSVEVSQAKAFTGALFRRDGPELQQVPSDLVTALAAAHGRGLLRLDSVTTLREGGRVIAGIGSSGATDDQDGECARAARDAYSS